MSKQTRVRGKNEQEPSHGDSDSSLSVTGKESGDSSQLIEELIDTLRERGLVARKEELHPELKRQIGEYLSERESESRHDRRDWIEYEAHRAAKVDRQFVQACPWFDVKIGTDLHVSADMFTRYYGATCGYITLLICRVGEKYGVDMSTTRTDVEDTMENKSSNKALEATA